MTNANAQSGSHLNGRCILVVGGRHKHVRHFRQMVEDMHGTFLHHDGGVETSLTRLMGLCSRADAVLFPVDCNSHNALDAVKQVCKRNQKRFIPMRRTGSGAFAQALQSAISA